MTDLLTARQSVHPGHDCELSTHRPARINGRLHLRCCDCGASFPWERPAPLEVTEYQQDFFSWTLVLGAVTVLLIIAAAMARGWL